ncbi:hypothetical protein ABZ816_18660 [Actinosynnema sp. NPDC047251]|uniref:Putative secreted protein n=1 Tax=Saccharothrix espanaensis (strain ATCC 51144 / DSM 44229 / JCM 9112 / NBRC 15066 / NRRL 15764) TaxID=1179773 RepID=K0K9L6_SACES|nr:hypothetical protein [Saccharothrix espanaensis]CCH33318.1 putative secreted protein [Saccharothrix espanaensis DSM 44229]
MTRGLRYVALWSASTAVAVALSWLGLRSVLDAGVVERPVILAGPTQSTAVPATTTTTTTPTVTTTTAPAPVVVTTTEPARTTTTTTTPTTTTTTTTTTATVNALPSDSGTWARDQNGEQVYLRSFQLRGGSAAIKFSPTDMEPISATPRQGYAANIEQPAHAVVVEFVGPGYVSRLEAMWINNGPLWRTLEEAR